MKFRNRYVSCLKGVTWMTLLILIGESHNGCSGAGESPTIDLGISQNVCPDICKVNYDTRGCAGISSLRQLKQNQNVSTICKTFLSGQLFTQNECELRCEGCNPEHMLAPCYDALRKKKKRNKYALCKLPAETGYCKGYFLMWYFNFKKMECQKFVYGGCSGNKNKFDDEMSCVGKCGMLAVMKPKKSIKDPSAHEEL